MKDYPGRFESIQDLFLVGMDRYMPFVYYPKNQDDYVQLNVGAGIKNILGTIPLDYPDWDAEVNPIPFPSNSVSVIHCYHVLEHINNLVGLLSEFQRVLIDGGVANILVPYAMSSMAFQDIDHKRFFTEESWEKLFNNPYYDMHRGRIDWKFEIHLNIIIGVVGHNLALVTQLIKK
jgi:SAM-dependent methyltransferase